VGRLLTIMCGLAAALLGQNTGTVTGILTSTVGAAVPGASVTAYLQGATSTNGSFPPVFSAVTASDGSFTLSGLAAGTYVVCAENASRALLNPCFWSAKTTRFTLAPGGTVTGVSLVAEMGVALNIRVNDAMGLMASNPKRDDVLIGVKPPAGPALPSQLLSVDSTGKTFTVLAPQKQLARILVYSANFSLSDNQGDSFATPNVAITVAAPSASASANSSTGASPAATATAPALTLNVLGQTPQP